MKKVEAYESADGKLYKSERAALEADNKYYELQSKAIKIRMIMSMITPVDSNALGSGEFYQHDVRRVLECRNAFLEYLREQDIFEDWAIDEAIQQDKHCATVLARFLSDHGGMFDVAYSRFQRISLFTGREYNQPYFVCQEPEYKKMIAFYK
jgi:hypothetical protein